MAVKTTVQYLTRCERYKTEKPYSTDFEVSDRFPKAQKSNYSLSEVPVSVEAIRDPKEFNLDVHGFSVVKAQVSLLAEDALHRPREVEGSYLAEIEAVLHERFPEYRRFEGMEFVVRKRDERFPCNEVAIVDFEQPACVAHSDYSVGGALLQLGASFPGQESYFEDKEFDMINVWRPLYGPNNDWPLALCDFRSINEDDDVVTADLLHRDRVGENQLLQANKGHRWYYVKDQQPDDLLIIRNVDSSGKRARAFHCAIFNPSSRGPPRASCEVRFVAIR